MTLCRGHCAGGFTLVELMLVLAIVGIVALAAIPAYRQPLDEARRAEAAACLVAMGGLIERRALVHGDPSGFRPAEAALSCRRMLAAHFRFEAGVVGEAEWLAETLPARQWRLRAMPRGGDGYAGRCAGLIYRYDGMRAVLGADGVVHRDAETLRQCWR